MITTVKIAAAVKDRKQRPASDNYKTKLMSSGSLIFANLYSQMITFGIMKANALSIVNAVEAAARADQGLQGGDADGGDLGADI